MNRLDYDKKYNLIELAQLAVEYPGVRFLIKSSDTLYRFDSFKLLTLKTMYNTWDEVCYEINPNEKLFILAIPEPLPSPIENKKLYAYLGRKEEVYFMYTEINNDKNYDRAPEYDIEYPLKTEKE